MDDTYQGMWAIAYPKINAGLITLDNEIDKETDDRIGITLLIRP